MEQASEQAADENCDNDSPKTRSIGIILSPFHSGSMQNYQNFIYNYCVLKTKIKYLVSYVNFKI